MNKKILFFIILFCIIIIIGITVLFDLFNEGYAHYGDVWQDTPEKALMKEADLTTETLQTLTPKTILHTVYIADIAEMTFVSIGDTLVTVTFVMNEKGQYSVYGYTEEIWLDSPTMFLLNGDPEQLDFESEQFVMFPYNQHKTTAWGWCYTGHSFTVNGIIPSKKTYIFDCQGKTWSIDYWRIDNVSPEADIQIDYVN